MPRRGFERRRFSQLSLQFPARKFEKSSCAWSAVQVKYFARRYLVYNRIKMNKVNYLAVLIIASHLLVINAGILGNLWSLNISRWKFLEKCSKSVCGQNCRRYEALSVSVYSSIYFFLQDVSAVSGTFKAISRNFKTVKIFKINNLKISLSPHLKFLCKRFV